MHAKRAVERRKLFFCCFFSFFCGALFQNKVLFYALFKFPTPFSVMKLKNELLITIYLKKLFTNVHCDIFHSCYRTSAIYILHENQEKEMFFQHLAAYKLKVVLKIEISLCEYQENLLRFASLSLFYSNIKINGVYSSNFSEKLEKKDNLIGNAKG